MTDPLPFKEPPTLMEQTLNLAPATTFEENVADFKQGRHLQRLAVAREFASGRPLIDFIREVESGESTIRQLLTEARKLGILNETSGMPEVRETEISKALTTDRSVREFSRLPEKDRQEIISAANTYEFQQEPEGVKRRERVKALVADAKARRNTNERAHSTGTTAEERKTLSEQERAAAIVRGALSQIRHSFGTLLNAVSGNPREKENVRDQLQELANQLAEAGIYPTLRPK